MRVRVAVLVAAVGVLLALAGCRSDPTVAAYVGSTRYSEDRVTAIADEAHAKLREFAQQSGAQQAVERPATDQQVVAALVSRDVLKALAKQKNISPAAASADQVAQRVQVPPDTEYVRVLAEKDGYRLGLLQQWPTAKQTSEADLREVYDNLVKGSGGQYTASFEEFKANVPDESIELVGRAASLRREVVAQAQKLDVTVNPRFGPTTVSLIDTTDQQGGPIISLFGVELNAQESGVKDLS